MTKQTMLTDRERILTAIICGLQTSSILCRRGDSYVEASWSDGSGRSYMHFARYRKPVKGDIVIGNTGRIDAFKIAIYVEYADPSAALHVVRDINTGQLCNYGNETFVPIVGLTYTDLLIGDERQLYAKVLAAFARAESYVHRFGGIVIDGKRATVSVREVFGGLGDKSVPYRITFDWTPRMSVKAVLQALRDGGFEKKSFRPEPAEVEPSR